MDFVLCPCIIQRNMNITLVNSRPYQIPSFGLQFYNDESLRMSTTGLFIIMKLNETGLFGEMVLEVLSSVTLCTIFNV
jgi:hypothetical protein